MKVVTIIPVRGGSKSIPLKNIININGDLEVKFEKLVEIMVLSDFKKVKKKGY